MLSPVHIEWISMIFNFSFDVKIQKKIDFFTLLFYASQFNDLLTDESLFFFCFVAYNINQSHVIYIK